MYLKKPTLLVILDGFGHSPSLEYNAIAQAKKPTIDDLLAHYPHTLLAASGKAVGLPPGVIGNSEVGHTTLGAGRVLPSPFLQLHESIASGAFFTNPILDKNLNELAQTDSTLHIIGLLSDAGVQSHQEIIYALLHAAMQHKIKKIVIHAILDGRDVPPKSAALYLEQLEAYIRPHKNISLGSISGRYYSMDRDNNWDRTQLAYQMLTTPQEPRFTNWQQALSYYYEKGITDEYIPPIILIPTDTIHDNDGVIFTNFREDRARQLTTCLY